MLESVEVELLIDLGASPRGAGENPFSTSKYGNWLADAISHIASLIGTFATVR